MKSCLRILFFVSAILCIVGGFERLGRGKEDAELREAALPPEVFLKNSQIGEVFGWLPSEYWRIVIYERDPAHWDEVLKIMKTFPKSEEDDRQMKAAIAAGFVVPPNAKRDDRIREQYSHLVARLPELYRRRDFSQRLKDCLAWIGAASICAVAGCALSRWPANDKTPSSA